MKKRVKRLYVWQAWDADYDTSETSPLLFATKRLAEAYVAARLSETGRTDGMGALRVEVKS